MDEIEIQLVPWEVPGKPKKIVVVNVKEALHLTQVAAIQEYQVAVSKVASIAPDWPVVLVHFLPGNGVSGWQNEKGIGNEARDYIEQSPTIHLEFVTTKLPPTKAG